jgi:hypothetical protein
MPKPEKIVFNQPKRINLIAYSKSGKELCIPVIVRYPIINPTLEYNPSKKMKISPVNFKSNGLALEFYFIPALFHDNNPTLFRFFTEYLPDHFLIPATFRNTRADDWTNSYHQPVSAGWLRAGRDGKLYLERDEETPVELDTANVDESLVAIATKIWEVYKKVDRIERAAEFIG